MKRWLLRIVVVIVAVMLVTAVRYRLKAEARKKREATYQSALQAYSQSLKPGLTRKDAEGYFRSKSVGFEQVCCIEERSAFADLVRIGEEEAPWFCSKNYVYVAFEFVGKEPLQLQNGASDTDVLKDVRIYRELAGCL